MLFDFVLCIKIKASANAVQPSRKGDVVDNTKLLSERKGFSDEQQYK